MAYLTTRGLHPMTASELKIYYRKMHPWFSPEPWSQGIRLSDDLNGSTLALIISADTDRRVELGHQSAICAYAY